MALHGSAAGLLVEASATAATIVLGAGSHRAVSRAVLGSVSHQVATHAQCPVVVVRRRASQDGAGAGDVVLGLDGSEVSTPATEYAFATASLQGLGLTVVHAWWREYLGGVLAHSPWEGDWSEVAEELERMMVEALSGWSEKYPDVEVHRHLVRGHAVEMLVQESEGAALLVVGSRGRGGFPGLLLGSVSNGVLQHADCPVAVVHRAGASAPDATTLTRASGSSRRVSSSAAGAGAVRVVATRRAVGRGEDRGLRPALHAELAPART